MQTAVAVSRNTSCPPALRSRKQVSLPTSNPPPVVVPDKAAPFIEMRYRVYREAAAVSAAIHLELKRKYPGSKASSLVSRFWVVADFEKAALLTHSEIRAAAGADARKPRVQWNQSTFGNEPRYVYTVDQIDDLKFFYTSQDGAQVMRDRQRTALKDGLASDTEDLLERQKAIGLWDAKVRVKALDGLLSQLRYIIVMHKPVSKGDAILLLRFLRDMDVAEREIGDYYAGVIGQNVANFFSGTKITKGFSPARRVSKKGAR